MQSFPIAFILFMLQLSAGNPAYPNLTMYCQNYSIGVQPVETVKLAAKANMIRLLIVGGPATVQKGLLMGLAAESDFNVIGETSSCEAALQLAHDLKPDVMVIDLEMPRGGGVGLAEMVQSISPDTAVIVLSMYDDHFTCTQARNAGVAALVGKNLPTTTLFAMIRAVAA